jgi:WD40 repeat protein
MVAASGGAHSSSDVAYIWDLNGPPDADPVALRNGNVKWLNDAALDREGRWLVTAHSDSATLWPLRSKRARVFRGQSPPYINVAFTPDGHGLLSSSDDGTVRLWPLSYAKSERNRLLLQGGGQLGVSMAVDPLGRYVLVGSRFEARVFLVPLEGGVPLRMPGFTEGEGWVGSPAFSPDGRLAVAAELLPSLLRIWDMESGEVQTLDTRVPGEKGCAPEKFRGAILAAEFVADGRLLTMGDQGTRIWDLETGSSRPIQPCNEGMDQDLVLDRARHRALIMSSNPSTRTSTFGSLDVETGAFQEITSHGNNVYQAAFDPTGTVIVTGSFDGVVRVGPLAGGEPHLLYGHTLDVSSVAVSPDGRWIASGGQDGTIRLWPMPEGEPFHALPYEEILERLRGLTNLRVVADENSDTGYRVVIGPFPGWAKFPEW